MKLRLPKFSLILLVAATLSLLFSCKSDIKLKTFEPAYESLLAPFTAKQIAIFSSGEKTDTIIFYPVEERLEKIRHVERGFYDTYAKRVEYQTTPGSYHHDMEDTKVFFLTLTNHSNMDSTQVWLHFLELGYDGDGIKKQIQTNPILFDRSSARDTFTEINVNYCIKDFRFDTAKGVVEFTDLTGHIWSRK